VLLVAVLGLIATLGGVLASPVATAIVVAGLFFASTVVLAFALRRRALFDGPYTILKTEVSWDLEDPDASRAICTKRLEVRFNYPVIALQERVWGDGDPFAEFQADFGELVKTGKDGPDSYGIIALPATRHRGEEAVLTSSRTTVDAFGGDEEWIDLDHSQASRHSSFKVRFPSKRAPREIRLSRGPDGRESAVTAESLRQEGGCTVFKMETRRQGRGQTFRLKWRW
jgi:hypothetical protein